MQSPNPSSDPQPASNSPPLHSFLQHTVVLIPALNEAEVIDSTVKKWFAIGVHSVRVIDNGSTDRTARIAQDSGATVIHEPRRGYGAAAWTGCQNLPPEARWILFTAADASDIFEPDEIALWQQGVDEGAELILGNRLATTDARQHLKWPQRLGSQIFHHVVRWGWNISFQDMGSRRLLSTKAWPRLQLEDRGFGWNVEMQIRAVECRLKILEIPCRYQPRRAGKSKISGNLSGSIRAGTAILTTLWRLWFTRHRRTQK